MDTPTERDSRWLSAKRRLGRAAAAVDDATPPDRDRVVDLVRAVAIVAVVLGHWIAAVATYESGTFGGSNALETVPLLRPLTWAIQVMPLFFVVAGFSGAASSPEEGRASKWGPWLHRRLLRIWRPASVFVGTWVVIAVLGWKVGAGDVLTRAGHLSMIQLWFLPVYLLTTALTPALVHADRRWGWRPVIVVTTAVAAIDLAGRVIGMPLVGGTNLVLVWLLFVQIGIRWRHGAAPNGPTLAAYALAATLLVTVLGPYPTAMVGVPGGIESNVMPPSLALVGLGLAQTGIVLTLRPALQRWLRRPRPWFLVVAVNRRAMTLYLWHMTAAVIAAIVLLTLGFPQPDPGSAAWWSIRPLWLLGCALALVILITRFGSAEDGNEPGTGSPGTARVGLCTVLLVGAFLRLTLQGPANATAPGADLVVVAVLVVAAALGALDGPGRRRATAQLPTGHQDPSADYS